MTLGRKKDFSSLENTKKSIGAIKLLITRPPTLKIVEKKNVEKILRKERKSLIRKNAEYFVLYSGIWERKLDISAITK